MQREMLLEDSISFWWLAVILLTPSVNDRNSGSSTWMLLVFIGYSIRFFRINTNNTTDSTSMATHRSSNFTTFSLLCLLGLAIGKPAPCVGKYPMEEAVIGKSVDGTQACSPGGFRETSRMTIYKWGLTVKPLDRYLPGCEQHITVGYTRSNQPAMIYHRPFTGPEFFKKSHPALYKKHKSGGHVQWPCHKAPLRRVHVWKNRAKFVSLLKLALREVEHIRGLDCAAPEHYGKPSDRFSWKQLRKKIAQDRITTAAINFLHGVAFRNFFCVWAIHLSS